MTMMTPAVRPPLTMLEKLALVSTGAAAAFKIFLWSLGLTIHSSGPAMWAGGPSALDALKQARWRGNVRELRNVVERLLIMIDRDTIEADDVRRVVRAETAGPPVAPAGKPAPGATTQPPTLREFKEWSERAFLVDKLREHDWNISKTADVIDTPRSNLYKKLEQYGIKQDIDG